MTKPCAACGADVPTMARSCPDCGAPNPARRAILAAALVVAVLGPAIAVAIYAATRWEAPLIAGDKPAESPLPSQSIAPRDDNFEWLTLAMKACDEKAAAEQNAVHMLVVPIAHNAAVVDEWRRQALNRIGNALVLPTNDVIAALRAKKLSIATEPYVFSIRDGKENKVRTWPASSGVKWLSIEDAADVTLFQMQYRPGGRGSENTWGNTIMHRKGSCYWVNALYED